MFSRLFNSSLSKNSIFSRIIRFQRRTVKTVSENEVEKGPIKFTTSKAAEWKAVYSNAGEDYFSTPKIQPLAIVMSVTVFMIYFCVLREENDLDEWLKNLEHAVPLQNEEIELREKIQTAKQNRLDSSAYEKELDKIMSIRKQIKSLQ